MSYNYPTAVNALRLYLYEPLNKTDHDFEALVPRIIEAAEQRCYRECDFLAVRSAPTSATTTASSRNATLPSSILVLESINLISPAGTTNPELGTRIPLERVSLDFMNVAWPVAATTGTPAKYALLSDTAIRIAPTPAGVFTLECIGTTLPAALSSSTNTTYLTTNYPDLFMAAMVKAGADFLQDDKLSADWNQTYMTAYASAKQQADRQKAASVSWSPMQPTPVANIPRERQ